MAKARSKISFKIGDWVRVKARTEVGYETEEEFEKGKRLGNIKHTRKLRRVPYTHEGVIGQIVGARRKMFGELKGGSTLNSYTGAEDYTDGYLEVQNSVIVWLVRPGYLNKPIEAVEEDIERPGEWISDELPWFSSSFDTSEERREKIRKEMSKDSKDWPRDEKGRFH